MKIYSHVDCFLVWVILNYVPMTTYKAACRYLFSLLLVQTLGFLGNSVILLFWSASRLFHNHCTISHSCRWCVVALPSHIWQCLETSVSWWSRAAGWKVAPCHDLAWACHWFRLICIFVILWSVVLCGLIGLYLLSWIMYIPLSNFSRAILSLY